MTKSNLIAGDRSDQHTSERELRLIVDQSPDLIMAYDMDRKLLYVNDAIEAMTGYTREEMLSQHFIKWVHDDDEQRMMKLWDSLYEGKSYTGAEFRRINRQGEVKWSLASWSPMYDEEGRQIGVQGSERDITEQKLAETRLLQSEQLFRAVFNEAGMGIAFLDVQRGVLHANRALQRILKCTGEELERLTLLDDLTVPEDREPDKALYLNMVEGRTDLSSMSKHFVLRDGTEVFANVIFTVLRDEDGKPKYVIGIHEDLTERKRAESTRQNLEEQLRQAQKMEAIGRLAGGIAHDFNNLLTVIRGYSDLLIETATDKGWNAPEVQEIRHAAERAATLTNQLLAFSRQQVLTPKVLNLNDVITNLANLLRRLLGEDVELSLRLEPRLGRVRIDPGQLEQVVMNLAVNARDAMENGGKLVIESHNEVVGDGVAGLKPGPYTMLIVRDTGKGIDKQTMKNIFEPFFTTKPQGKGTGLGLSTVYGIVTQSEGHIAVSSELGVGTTFKVYLPRVDEPFAKNAAASQPAGGSEVILVVEDEPAVGMLIKSLLMKQGYEVKMADSEAEALAICAEKEQPIDLLLSDVVLKQMNGRELSERLKALRPGLRVLFMSGYTDDAILQRGVSEAETAFLQKPFDSASLGCKVREVLDAPSQDHTARSRTQVDPFRR